MEKKYKYKAKEIVYLKAETAQRKRSVYLNGDECARALIAAIGASGPIIGKIIIIIFLLLLLLLLVHLPLLLWPLGQLDIKLQVVSMRTAYVEYTYGHDSDLGNSANSLN
jgi:hypothetical protein